MKKSIVILIGLTLTSHIMQAQESYDCREKIQLGVKIGANLSNVYDSKGEQFQADSKLGLAAGAFIALPLGKYIGIQPEVLYSQKGFQASGVILGSPYRMTRTTSYIDVPVLFAFKPFSFLTILAGPQYSYLIKQKDVFENGSTTIAQETEFENANIRKNILCFTGGVDISVKHLVLGFRAGWDLHNNNGDGTTTTPRYKNVWYQATIGYRLWN